MFTISVETHFSALHQLVSPDDSREPLHQHNWLVTAVISSDKLNSMGLVMDFQRLKSMIDKIIGEFADKNLCEFDYFQRNGSSAEIIAEYIYEKLKPDLPKTVKLNHINIVEEPGCSAKFSE